MLGRPYKFGGNGETTGEPFDCFGMLVEYERLRFGSDILKLYEHLDFPFFTYKNNDETAHFYEMGILKEYLDKCFIRVAVNYILPGDILWTSAEGNNALGIYLGSQKMMVTAPEFNCVTMPTEYYKIEDAYRWLRLSL